MCFLHFFLEVVANFINSKLDEEGNAKRRGFGIRVFVICDLTKVVLEGGR